jgi:hypothetical protein
VAFDLVAFDLVAFDLVAFVFVAFVFVAFDLVAFDLVAFVFTRVFGFAFAMLLLLRRVAPLWIAGCSPCHIVEEALDLARGLEVGHRPRPSEPRAEYRLDLAAPLRHLERLRLVEERVALLRIGFDGAVVVGDRFVEATELLAFLRKPVEQEAVVRLGGEQGAEFLKAVGLWQGHGVFARFSRGSGGSAAALGAGFLGAGRRILYSPMPVGTHQTDFSFRPHALRIAAAASAHARSLLVSAALVTALLAAAACSTAPPGTPVIDEEEAKLPPRERSMRVTSGFGGTHRHSVVENGTWYQSFENRVLFLDAQTGTELVDLELAPRGTTGVVSDFLVRGERMFAVLEDDWVIELDIATVREPKVLSRWGRAELGIRPAFVAAIGDELYISGDGGVVRLSETTRHGTLSIDSKGRAAAPERPTPMLEGRDVGRVVAAKGGPVACVGRRILRVADGSFLGSASMLIELPDAVGGGYGFMRQSTEGASVGLMDAEFRERSATALRGQVYSIRFFDDRFFAINDFEVATWRMDEVPQDPAVASGDGSAAAPKRDFALGALLSVPVKGARDIAKVQRNRFAVAGSFGRALYRYLPEGDKPGDTFYWSRRLPGRLDVAVTDRRRVLAAGREGTWLYLIGEEAELSDAPITSPDRPVSAVETAWGSATVEETRDAVTFRMGDKSQVHTLANGALVSGLCAADGKVWIGHERGIDVIGYDPLTQQIVFEERIRLVGPMVALYPNRVGGGITFVSGQSGFGVVRPVDAESPPIAARGTRSAFETTGAAVDGNGKGAEGES